MTERRYDGNGNVTEWIGYAKALASVPATDDPAWVPAPQAGATDQHVASVYDALDRAIYTVDAVGAIVKQAFDGNGNVTDRVAYAAKHPEALGASKAALDNLTAAMAPDNADAHTRLRYDAADRLVYSVDGVGAVTRYGYDGNGNVLSETRFATAIGAGAEPATVAGSAADRTTKQAYDKANRLVFSVDALGGVTENSYDDNGNLLRRAAYDVQIAANTASSLGAIRSQLPSAPGNSRFSYATYDAANRLQFAVDAQGALVETRYDLPGHAVTQVAYAKLLSVAGAPAQLTAGDVAWLRQVDANNDRMTTSVFDLAGRLKYSIAPDGHPSSTAYDALGRIAHGTQHFAALGGGVARTLSAVDSALASDPRDRRTDYAYDAAGRLASSTDPLGNTERYTYDALGNKRSFINKKQNVWSYEYDAAGRLVQETSPQVLVTSVGVAADGTLSASADTPAAIVTRLAYDALGNLTERIEALGLAGQERSTRYRYDSLGRQVMTIFPKVAIYDAANDALSTSGGVGRIELVGANAPERGGRGVDPELRGLVRCRRHDRRAGAIRGAAGALAGQAAGNIVGTDGRVRLEGHCTRCDWRCGRRGPVGRQLRGQRRGQHRSAGGDRQRGVARHRRGHGLAEGVQLEGRGGFGGGRCDRPGAG